jgi:hypothetical protein
MPTTALFGRGVKRTFSSVVRELAGLALMKAFEAKCQDCAERRAAFERGHQGGSEGIMHLTSPLSAGAGLCAALEFAVGVFPAGLVFPQRPGMTGLSWSSFAPLLTYRPRPECVGAGKIGSEAKIDGNFPNQFQAGVNGTAMDPEFSRCFTGRQFCQGHGNGVTGGGQSSEEAPHVKLQADHFICRAGRSRMQGRVLRQCLAQRQGAITF